MFAPSKLKFSNVDKWKSTNFFPTILKYVKGSILENDLPKSVILVDTNSSNEYEANLIEIVPFKKCIPDIFSLLVKNIPGNKFEEELLKHYPTKSIEDFAFYLYQFKLNKNE